MNDAHHKHLTEALALVKKARDLLVDVSDDARSIFDHMPPSDRLGVQGAKVLAGASSVQDAIDASEDTIQDIKDILQ